MFPISKGGTGTKYSVLLAFSVKTWEEQTKCDVICECDPFIPQMIQDLSVSTLWLRGKISLVFCAASTIWLLLPGRWHGAQALRSDSACVVLMVSYSD